MLPKEGLQTSVSPVDLTLPIPDEWEEVGTLQKIFIYPLKSGKPNQVKNVQVAKCGLRTDNYADRQMMIINKHSKKLITGRNYSKLVLVEVTFNEKGTFTFSGPKMEPLTVKLSSQEDREIMKTKVWTDSVEGTLLGKESDDWISKFVNLHHGEKDFAGREVQLQILYHPEVCDEDQPKRQLQDASDPLKPFVKSDDVGIYADVMPVTIHTIPSLNELNRRLKEKNANTTVDETQLRPNLIVSGNFEPFAEDQWTYIKINDVIFRNALLCGRCKFTTVNPESGEKNVDEEPLKTLKSFRTVLNPEEREKIGESPFFGIHLGVDSSGTMNEGDKVFVGKINKNWKPATKPGHWAFKAFLGTWTVVAANIMLNLASKV